MWVEVVAKLVMWAGKWEGEVGEPVSEKQKLLKTGETVTGVEKNAREKQLTSRW